MAVRTKVPRCVIDASLRLCLTNSAHLAGLDLVRLLSLSSPLAKTIPSLLEVVQDTSGAAKEQETNSMLAFRALANVFGSAKGKSIMKDEAVEVRLPFAFLESLCSLLLPRSLTCSSGVGSLESARTARWLWQRWRSSELPLASSEAQPLTLSQLLRPRRPKNPGRRCWSWSLRSRC